MVREMTTEVLRESGYNVLVARHGTEALQVAAGYGGSVDLLLSDVVMPQMSGRQLVERLTPLRPTMRVLYMSGYTDDAIVHHGVLDPGTAFIEKPFTPDSIVRKVRSLLDENSKN
jgi:two-component system cell cycle sensor histidine kinase/response regulator CckA